MGIGLNEKENTTGFRVKDKHKSVDVNLVAAHYF